MADPSSDGRAWPRVHALLEQYTPDGWLGRLLLGLLAGSAAGALLPLALFGFVSFTLLSVLGGLLTLTGGVATALLTVVTLWPVYLSLIGNVESAADYDPPAATARSRSTYDADRPAVRYREDAPADPAEDDSVALLKRRYAAGELSDEEFERRLDRLLAADERAGAEADRADRDRVLEADR